MSPRNQPKFFFPKKGSIDIHWIPPFKTRHREIQEITFDIKEIRQLINSKTIDVLRINFLLDQILKNL